MLIAIDTTGPICAVALRHGDGTIVSRSEEIGRGHAEHLMPSINAVLNSENVEWNQINAIACTTGPGSFTGLRVGLATAKGLALALNCPCMGVSVFQVFAHAFGAPLAVALDAKRNEIWMQIFDTKEHQPFAVNTSDALDRIPIHINRIAGSASAQLLAGNNRFIELDSSFSPPIDSLAEYAAGQDISGSYRGGPQPLYLRVPDAKPQPSLKAII